MNAAELPAEPTPVVPAHAPAPGAPRVLVVCHSRTGRTRKLGQALAAAVGGDLELLQDHRHVKRPKGVLRCALEAVLHRRPWIRPTAHRSGDYSLVMIGTPVWARNVAGPVRSYLTHRRGRLRRVAYFCTYGAYGHEKVLADLAALGGEPPVASLAVSEHSVDRDEFAASLAAFVERLAPGRR